MEEDQGNQYNSAVELEDDISREPGLPDYFIAIGASAGGLEALQEFFQSMPSNTGAAFIVIQHLSPDFKSVMAELLERSTKMSVFNASDGIPVQSNTVYLIQPRKNMMVAEGKLILVDQMPDTGVNFPIDIFFRSLAEDQHHRTIGVVLSGTGSDGSRGIQAIKEVGGLVMIQDPKTAKFDGMPYNAVRTGLADMVLAADEMPSELVNYMNHPLISGQGKSLLKYVEDNDSALKEILVLLKERSEIDFSQYKVTTVARRIERRIGINQLENLQQYYSLLSKSPQELNILAKDMLIGVTRFFRDDEPFAELEKVVVPAILDQTSENEPIRIWVAGCSSGEEAYSLAMLFHHQVKLRKQSRAIKIFATDVDAGAINEASAGKYPLSVKGDIPEQYLNEYFTLKGDDLCINPVIRQMVVFAVHNLVADPPFSNTQLTVCRNVLIYFQQKAQKNVLSNLQFSLQRNGYLFLGLSESLGDLQSYFDVINERCRIFRKNAASKLIRKESNSLQEAAADGALPNIQNLLRSYRGYEKPAASTLVADTLIQDYVPDTIVLNSTFDVIHIYGDVSAYTQSLKPGQFSANIKNIIVDDLSVAVSTALHRAQQSEDDVVYKDVIVDKSNENEKISISLVVKCLKDKRVNDYFFVLTFENPVKMDRSKLEHAIQYDAKDQNQQRINDLEMELSRKQEHLQVTIEELETTNEELQSSNEELLAANEELQSTNEELQSVNEELYTVNSEYQDKIEELVRSNTDLDNIIKSTTIGIVFLDDGMLIRNFSPAATQHINLLNTDIGRPFHHIAHNLEYDSLLKDLANVIESGESTEQEVETTNGHYVLVKIVPYFTERNEAKGCILTLAETTHVKRLESQLRKSYQELQATVSQSVNSLEGEVNILLVDDDESDLQILAHHMKAMSFKCVVTLSKHKDEACELLKAGQFDICFIDYYLDGANAFDLIASFSKEQAMPAFILLSGAMDDNMKRSALELGIYDTIYKNELSASMLERCVRYVTRLRETERYLELNQATS